MALGAKITNLIRLNLLNNPDQVGAVGEIAVLQHQARVALVRILVEVIDPGGGVETAGPALDPMHHINLLQQELAR